MENGIAKPMLRSLLVSYVLSGILLAVLAFALYQLRLKEGQVNIMVYAIYFITCLLGGLTAGKGIRQRRFFWGLLSGLLYFLVLFAVSWLMNRGSAIDIHRSLTVMALCAAGGTLGGMLSRTFTTNHAEFPLPYPKTIEHLPPPGPQRRNGVQTDECAGGLENGPQGLKAGEGEKQGEIVFSKTRFQAT